MTELELFAEQRPAREQVAAAIMPAAFAESNIGAWKKGAQRRALALADEILEIVRTSPDSGAPDAR